MSFICGKVLKIGGTEYKPGDVIPDGVVLDERVRTLKANGYINEVGDGNGVPVAGQQEPPKPAEIEIPVKSESGEDMVVKLTQEEVVAVLTVMQLNAEECAEAIGNESRENVLIMVHAVDTRKTVKSAVKNRVAELGKDDDTNAETGGNGATGQPNGEPQGNPDDGKMPPDTEQ